ncbi:CDP-diacylglycerol--serine O-phosphatidyltransferase [Tabrizicola sp. J26]|uniref:CDP-diacylglycerol--serine O-phosphatidyltransferase n=1 Tax=Alitabrizicola rongguiensis TaxID=2909234 RepID=UPI001F386251|nr:CDP-diacylglycerol--serine O-phosphatidyltransferase [Tabrizicola rongguiensis]MCF1707645.1 CDP-diacylglycerol--serine O-phosphatidyltransferase [Tabrizicola rongguiensis]
MSTRGDDNLPILQLLPNAVTILALCAGLTSIRYAMEGRFDLAAILIVLAAVLDGMDGTLARRLDATSTIGAELDSLSDFLAFGVAPALLIFRFAQGDAQGFGWAFVLVYAICACLRLARFNVNRDTPPNGRPVFIGVPSPGGALLALIPLFLAEARIFDASVYPQMVGAWLALAGLLMASRVPTPSSKALRVKREYARFVLVGLAGVIGLAVTRFWLLMVVLSLGYALVIAFAVLRHLLRHRRF